jgi:hypothetical protein
MRERKLCTLFGGSHCNDRMASPSMRNLLFTWSHVTGMLQMRQIIWHTQQHKKRNCVYNVYWFRFNWGDLGKRYFTHMFIGIMSNNNFLFFRKHVSEWMKATKFHSFDFVFFFTSSFIKAAPETEWNFHHCFLSDDVLCYYRQHFGVTQSIQTYLRCFRPRLYDKFSSPLAKNPFNLDCDLNDGCNGKPKIAFTQQLSVECVFSSIINLRINNNNNKIAIKSFKMRLSILCPRAILSFCSRFAAVAVAVKSAINFSPLEA